LDKIVLVSDYGAVGDGSADDATALANAITAATGKTLQFETGKTYLISATLTVRSGTVFLGNGCTIKAKDSAALANGIFHAPTGLTSFSLSDITLDANGDNTGSDYGVWLEGGSNVVFNNVNVKDSRDAGIRWDDVSQSSITGGTMTNCGRATICAGTSAYNNHGVMVTSIASECFDVTLRNVSSNGHYRKGIALYSRNPGLLHKVRIVDCYANGGHLGGIYTGIGTPGTDSAIKDIQIVGCTASGNYANFDLNDVDGLLLSNCRSVSSIDPLDSTNGAQGFIILRCNDGIATGISDTLSALGGIQLNSCSRFSVVSPNVYNPNTLVNGFAPGIELRDSSNCVVSDATVVDDRGTHLMTYGIAEQGTCSGNLISVNTVSGSTAADYYILAADTLLRGRNGRATGFGTGAPLNTLHVSGGITLDPQTITLVNGVNQNVSLPGNAGVLISDAPTSSYSIGGIAGGHAGRRLTLYNYTGAPMTLNHQDSGSSSGNKFTLASSANVVVPTLGSVNLIYLVLSGTGTWVVA
jgi:hypothetical protein